MQAISVVMVLLLQESSSMQMTQVICAWKCFFSPSCPMGSAVGAALCGVCICFQRAQHVHEATWVTSDNQCIGQSVNQCRDRSGAGSEGQREKPPAV